MSKSHPVLGHILSSILALVISLIVVFFSLLLSQDILANPQRYFAESLTETELLLMIVSVSGVIVSISISLVIYLLGTSKTRTELSVWKATRWLATSREEFRRLYDGAPVPYIMLNNKGEIHEPNKSALRFFGVVSNEIENKSLFSFLPEEDAEHAKKLFELYKRNIPINREELRFITKSGAIKWALLSVFEIKNPTDNSHTGLATLFDITEIKKLEQAKIEFLSITSHQLRTPLATVKWYMEMLLSGDLGELAPKQKEYMERLEKVNEDMIGLVEMLLNVSRTEIGTLPVEKKPTNVRELSESILAELSPQIVKRELTINKNYNDLLENINSDPKLLRIVIQNIISNAVKYTPEKGEITITFSDSMGIKGISVSDNGYGIPKSQQDQIFTKLFRADNAKKLSTTQGTGLGLYLVKSIMESLGGSISFVSEENQGTTFNIKL
jgi:PAS domain S-box-containing protein